MCETHLKKDFMTLLFLVWNEKNFYVDSLDGQTESFSGVVFLVIYSMDTDDVCYFK